MEKDCHAVGTRRQANQTPHRRAHCAATGVQRAHCAAKPTHVATWQERCHQNYNGQRTAARRAHCAAKAVQRAIACEILAGPTPPRHMGPTHPPAIWPLRDCTLQQTACARPLSHPPNQGEAPRLFTRDVARPACGQSVLGLGGPGLREGNHAEPFKVLH